MSSKKVKVLDTTNDFSEHLLVMRAAVKIYADYVLRATPPAVHDIQISRLGDYLKHFGFTFEKELPLNPLETTLKGVARLQSFFPEDEAEVRNASWGIGDDLKKEADARSSEVDCATFLGTAPKDTLVECLSKHIVCSFDRVSRTQSAIHSAIKKARTIYMWLARNITVTLEPLVKDSSTPVDGLGKTRQVPRKNSYKKENIELKSADFKKKGISNAVLVIDKPDILPLSSFTTALIFRRASPKLLAELYTQMLLYVGIHSRVVDGWLKGPSAEEAVDWAWNIVEIDNISYLVDVALSSYSGPLRIPKSDASLPVLSDSVKGKSVIGSSKKKKAPLKKDLKKEDQSQSVPQQIRDSGENASVSEFLTLTTSPVLSARRRPVEDFYFFAKPTQFIHTHFPNNENDTFLSSSPSRVSWDLAPRQTHSIFQFGISLLSHQRNQCFTVRSTPVYISFKNENPASVQLCCILFKGSLWDLPEDLHNASPLPPDIVWHQRCEKDNIETFTIMVSEGGFYCALIGARHIRGDPYTSHISQEPFTPITEYQIKVNFVPIPTPAFPRQHLPPNLCRLMTPLSRHVLAGRHQFIVMPSCSNITAVALVKYIPPESGGGEVGELVERAEEDLINGTREFIQLLHFEPENAIYQNEVEVEPSAILELWVLYQAPDRNGFTFHENVAIEEKERVPPLLPSPRVEKKTKNQLKSKPLVENTATDSEVAELAQLRREVTAGRAFLPFITGIQGKTLLSRETGEVVQPLPSVESEKGPVMRRLAGVTPALYSAATELQNRQFRPVGGYYRVPSK